MMDNRYSSRRMYKYVSISEVAVTKALQKTVDINSDYVQSLVRTS